MADSNITKHALAAALKTLMADRPFAKISVGDICEACGMSRKSFYYHFQDKYELLNWIFFTEFVTRMQQQPELTGWQMLDEICAYFYENAAFYRRAFEVEGQNSFSEYFHDFAGTVLACEMEQIFGKEENIAFYTDFYLDALDCAIRRWLKQRDPMPAAQFCGLLKRGIVGVSGSVMEKLSQEGAVPPPPDGRPDPL